MVHRAVIGSVERAVAHLIEVYQGAFPAWLAPVQLLAQPVAEEQRPQAEALVQQALRQGLRAELADPQGGTLGARVRAGRLVPYQAVIGAAEAADGLVSLRLRDGRRVGPLPVPEALRLIGDEARVGQHT
jgi:threonyl-tRNA synthetase